MISYSKEWVIDYMNGVIIMRIKVYKSLNPMKV